MGQRVEPVIGQRSRKGNKLHELEDGVLVAMGEDCLFDPATPASARVDEAVKWNPVDGQFNPVLAVVTLLGGEGASVGDEQAQAPRAGVVDARVKDFLKAAAADREPDETGAADRGADPVLRAGQPVRRIAGPTWRVVRRAAGEGASRSCAGLVTLLCGVHHEPSDSDQG